MADFATDEWIRDRGHRLEGVEIDPELTLTIEQRIDGDGAWTITIADGRATVVAGGVADPDVCLSTDRPTAEAIHRGELSAQRAFLDGQLRIGGDVAALIEHRRSLAAVNTALADDGDAEARAGAT